LHGEAETVDGFRAKVNPLLRAYVENPRTFSSCPFLSLFTGKYTLISVASFVACNTAVFEEIFPSLIPLKS
jgi:hypothetical protein